MKRQQNNRNSKNNRYFGPPVPQTKSCQCGGTQKMKTRTTHTHGQKSKATRTKYFKCDKCGKTSNGE